MTKYVDIIDFFVHKFQCNECGKYIRFKIKKEKLPEKHSGIYYYKSKIKCGKCKSINDIKVGVFYTIKPRRYDGYSKEKRSMAHYKNSLLHKVKVHCRKCIRSRSDCKTKDCEFYGTVAKHKLRDLRTDDDFWWCVPISQIDKAIDKHYLSKCKTKTKEESNDSSTIPNTDTSSKN